MKINFVKLDHVHRKPVMDIYNYYVENSTAAFPENPLPEEAFDRFLGIGQSYPAYAVIDSEAAIVIGFCLLSDYLRHSSFRTTAVLTYFIAPDFVGKGVGSKCLRKLEEDACDRGIHNLIADISTENTGSIHFHQKHGFQVVGQLDDVACKFGRTFGIVLMKKNLA